jgi:hypothetical protein
MDSRRRRRIIRSVSRYYFFRDNLFAGLFFPAPVYSDDFFATVLRDVATTFFLATFAAVFFAAALLVGAGSEVPSSGPAIRNFERSRLNWKNARKPPGCVKCNNVIRFQALPTPTLQGIVCICTKRTDRSFPRGSMK